VFAQQCVSQSLSVADTETRRIIQGIEAGDVNSLSVAAVSGNQVFVPYLREQLLNSKAKLHNEISLLQVGLAKAGQLQQLTQLSCELNFGDASTRFGAMRKLDKVGGWFAISNMAEFLRDDPKYTSVFGDGLGPLQEYALQFLPNLVPPPPPAPSKGFFGLEQTKVIKTWRSYLDSHHDSLTKLPPTGEGVNISEALCKRVLKHDPAISRKRKPREKPPLLAQ
jgi:hypothetical protein